MGREQSHGVARTGGEASRKVQEDGNECLLVCVNALKNAAIAVNLFYGENNLAN